MNWVDLVIILVLIYFCWSSLGNGFLSIFFDFLSFGVSVLISFRIYKLAASFIKDNFSLSFGLSNAIGFLLTAVFLEFLLSRLFDFLYLKIPEKFRKSKTNKFLGVVPGFFEGLIIIAFVLLLFIALPISPTVKQDISDSRIGGVILEKATRLERAVDNIFGEAIGESLTYLTVKPKSDERISLQIGTRNLSTDQASEEAMLQKVQNERKKRSLKELSFSSEMKKVARDYATTMWNGNYFGHISMNGEDVGDRLLKAHVFYTLAGENLALAPNVNIAHTGLMNSEGHKANILSPDFRRVGIGVIDNGFYGKIFVQVFAD